MKMLFIRAAIFPAIHSPMPALCHRLNAQQLNDLVAFLATLQGAAK